MRARLIVECFMPFNDGEIGGTKTIALTFCLFCRSYPSDEVYSCINSFFVPTLLSITQSVLADDEIAVSIKCTNQHSPTAES